MGGLSESLLNHGPVKVFAHEHPNSNSYDKKSIISTIENRYTVSVVSKVKGHKVFEAIFTVFAIAEEAKATCE